MRQKFDLTNVNRYLVPHRGRVFEIARKIAKGEWQPLMYLELLMLQALGAKEYVSILRKDGYGAEENEKFFYKGQSYFTGEATRPTVTVRNEITLKTIAKLGDFKNIFDFGCHYGWLANECAKKFPNSQVFATERDNRTIELNNQHFSLPNLKYVCVPDFAEYVRRNPELFANGVFSTTYTLMFLLPNAIREIFAALKAAGLKYIVLTENLNISKVTFSPYQLSHDSQLSIMFRDRSILHNYPEMLESAGFEVIDASHEMIGEWGMLSITARNLDLD